MDEKLIDQDVLLVKEKGSDELKVVAGIDKNGNPKTVAPKQENNPDFLLIDKNGNALENFMSNFMRQCKKPTSFEFFNAPADKIQEVVERLQEAFKKPDEPASKAITDMHKVEPQEPGQKQSIYAIDENRIDWSQLERLGVTRETLERTKSLEVMLNWQKSPGLIPIVVKIEDIMLRTDARLSFREAPDGKLSVAIHALRKEPELDRPYFGVKFTDEDKQNLFKTGNLGRIVDAQYKQGETTSVFLSLDKLTNELVAVRTDKIKIPDTIKGVTLEDRQKQALSEGKPVLVEGMTSKNGSEFSANIQVNADKRGIEFQFNNVKKQEQNQQQTQRQSESGDFRIPTRLGGVDLTEKQQNELNADKAIYVSGMKDRQGQEYNAYVKINREEGKLDFFKWNPDKSKVREITPDNVSKTQVAVNSEGKTNEATKKVEEPLKKGQTQPTEKQSEKREKKEAKKIKQEPDKLIKPKKSKGIKV